MNAHTSAFSWDFLHDLVIWSCVTAVAVGIGGAAVTRSASFAIAFAVAASLDILTLEAAVRRGRTAHERQGPMQPTSGLIISRLAVKAVLLVAAALFLTGQAAFWGTVAGVLVVDSTVLVFGSAKAASQAFARRGRTGGPKRSGGE